MATPALTRTINIQAGGADDLDSVMQVMEAAFGTAYGEAWTRSQCAGILPMAGVALMVARDAESGDTLGFSLFRNVADDAELLLLAVRPDRHREGIGTLLLDDFLDCARRKGAVRVHLEVRDGNPAVDMYRASGFAPIGRRRNYYHGPNGRRFDAITLGRNC
jgi:ribosomal-protein-alanine N-acetyltransferase